MNLSNVEMRRRLQGTWQMPQTDNHQTTVTLHHNGPMHMTIAACSPRERGRQILSGDQVSGNWYITDRKRPRGAAGSLSSSSSSFGSSFRPPLPRDRRSDSVKGPYIVLNVQDLPKAIANVHIFGIRVDLANWAVAFDELSGGYHLRIVDLSNFAESIEVEVGNGQVQTWHRIKRES